MVLGSARLWLLLLSAASMAQGAKEMSAVVHGAAKVLTEKKVELSLKYNWPDLLMSAPKSIDLLGQIGLLASKTMDFKLERPSSGSYKYLLHRSFKSGLVQVSESGWQAFRKAHKSMDEIALRTADMPHNLKQLLTLMANKNPDDIETYGPIYLDSVKLGMAQCKARAQETVKVFNEMNLVVTEIIQGATSTKLSANLNLTSMRIMRDVRQSEQVNLKLRKKQLDQDITSTRKSVKVWEDKYIKAMDSFPSGWTQLGMTFCESLVKIVTFGASSGANRAVREINKDMKKSNKPQPSFATCITSPTTFPAQKPLTGLEKAKLRIVVKMDEIIVKAIEDFKSKMEAADLNIDQQVYAPVLTFVDAYIKAITSSGVQKGTSGPFVHVLQKLKSIANDARQTVVANQGAGKYAEYKSKLEAVQKTAICLCTMATEILDEPALAQTQLPTNKDVAQGSITQSHMKNAEMMLNKKEKRLKDLEERYEQQQKQAVTVNKELQEVMTAIKRLKSGIVTTEEMLKVLKKALALLGKFKKEWQKLTRFFDAIETAIIASLGPKVDIVTTFFERTLESKKMFTKALGNILFEDIMQVVAESLVIKRIARKYTDLSGKHLMPMVELAGQLVTVQEDSDETDKLERELNKKVTDSENYLQDLLTQETVMFKSAIDRRKKELRNSLTPLIGQLDNKSKREIEQSVQTGMETAVAIREEYKEPDPVEQLVDGTFSAESAIVDLEFDDEDDGLDFDF